MGASGKLAGRPSESICCLKIFKDEVMASNHLHSYQKPKVQNVHMIPGRILLQKAIDTWEEVPGKCWEIVGFGLKFRCGDESKS